MEKYKKYYNTGATEAVWILKVLYYINIPLAKWFVKNNIRPHTITTLSNISALASYVLLFIDFYFFAFFWFLALIFDICDGVVARMTKRSSAAGSFYDHYSDIAKILLLFLVVGIKYNITPIWMLVMLNTIIFSLMAIANMILSQRLAILRYELKSDNTETLPKFLKRKKNIIKRAINKLPVLKNILLFIHSSIFLIYGNFYLILIPLGINEDWAFYTLILIFIIVFRGMYHFIKGINKNNIIMKEHNIKWK